MKVFLISHIADIDGLTPVVLSKLVFKDFDYKLLEISEVDSYMNEALDNNFFDEYDKVFMTDLCINEETAKRIDNLAFKDKFQVIDHHIGNLALNKYSFIKVVDEENGFKESGTSLYYKYLLEHHPIKILATEAVSYMVSLVRLGDTWEWVKYNKQEARYLSTLLSYYGTEKYINNYFDFLLANETFFFTESEKLLIEVDNRRMNDYIEIKKEQIIFEEIKGYKVGIVFAELYRSELGNILSKTYPDVDLIAIINMGRSISYRTNRDDVSVNDFAMFFGGKGHQKAAGSPLPVGLKESIIDYIFRRENNEY